MLRPDLRAVLACLALIGAAAPAQAQSAPSGARLVSDEPRLVFEREVFEYAGRARRDPFQPLTRSTDGPLFTDIKLHMILYSEDPANSVVSVSDGSKKQYRLRRGESVGNATIIDIGPSRVVFSVMDFGIRRQEVLALKDNREGA
jgi:type II secretory pathway component PulC